MAGSTISFNASGLKFDIKTFNDYSGYKGLDNYGFDNVYDEIDYSQNPENAAQAKENAIDKVEAESDVKKEAEAAAKTANVETDAPEGDAKLNDNAYYKGGYNGLSKFTSTLINIFEGGGNKTFGYLGYGGEALVVFGGMMLGGEGFWKSFVKMLHVEGKQVAKKLAVDKWIGQSANIDAIKNFKENFTIPADWGIKQKAGSILADSTFRSAIAKQFGGLFVFNTVFNVVWDVLDGGEFKLGTDIYKGAVMCVFGTAGKLFGKFIGGKFTEALFNMAGAWVAEVTVKWYDTEWGRGIAGVAIVIGGAIGLVIGIAAGWCLGVVALVVIGVAAIGGFIVWAVEKLIVNWSAITSAVGNFFASVGAGIVSGFNSLVSGLATVGKAAMEFAEDVVEFFEDAADAVVEAGKAVVETVTEAVDVVVDEVVDFVEDVGAAVCKGWNTVCSWFC